MNFQIPAQVEDSRSRYMNGFLRVISQESSFWSRGGRELPMRTTNSYTYPILFLRATSKWGMPLYETRRRVASCANEKAYLGDELWKKMILESDWGYVYTEK